MLVKCVSAKAQISSSTFTFVEDEFHIFSCHGAALLRFRHKNQLAMVRKTSRFSLKYPVLVDLDTAENVWKFP